MKVNRKYIAEGLTKHILNNPNNTYPVTSILSPEIEAILDILDTEFDGMETNKLPYGEIDILNKHGINPDKLFIASPTHQAREIINEIYENLEQTLAIKKVSIFTKEEDVNTLKEIQNQLNTVLNKILYQKRSKSITKVIHP